MIEQAFLFGRLARVLALTCAFWATALPAQARPRLPAPPDTTVESVGENMTVNGIPMDIREFVSEQGSGVVLDFYRNFWPRGTLAQPGFTETDALPPWRILTRVDDGFLMTVQVTDDPGGGSRGYLAISRLLNPDHEPRIGAGFPVMQGSVVYNDVVSNDPGKAGRTAIDEHLPAIRDRLGLDFVVVNGENAAHGFGITDKICAGFYAAGADVITTGNHVWDQREIINYIDGDPKLLRPMNYPEGTPGRGTGIFETGDGRKVLVVHPMCRLFMEPLDDPFAAVDAALADHELGRTVDAIVIDCHGEATSEKQAMGHFSDGRVSAVVGTHTHVPTADAQVLPGGTAFLTDIGMTGDYDSVIGMQKELATSRFTTKPADGRLEPAEGEATLCAAYVETDDATGLATRIAPLRTGGRLQEAWPA